MENESTGKELQTVENNAVTPQEKIALMKEQSGLIHSLLEQVMTKDADYGVVPGCGPKPTLLKPGAEKIAFTLGLRFEPEVKKVDLGNGHREYEITVRVTNRDGVYMGFGVGNCSTMEAKYRYRNRYEDCGPVPDKYWKTRDQSLIGGPGYSTKKINGQWRIVSASKTENPDIADTYNTVLKMAKKRAIVDAVLTVTAASAMFTQDIEDMDMGDNAQHTSHAESQGEAPDGTDHEAETKKEINDLMIQMGCRGKKDRVDWFEKKSKEKNLDALLSELVDKNAMEYIWDNAMKTFIMPVSE